MPQITTERTSKAETRVLGTLHRRQTTLGRQPEPSRFASFLCCILVIVVLCGGCFVVAMAGIRSFVLARQEQFQAAQRFDRICFGVALTVFFTACVIVVVPNY